MPEDTMGYGGPPLHIEVDGHRYILRSLADDIAERSANHEECRSTVEQLRRSLRASNERILALERRLMIPDVRELDRREHERGLRSAQAMASEDEQLFAALDRIAREGFNPPGPWVSEALGGSSSRS